MMKTPLTIVILLCSCALAAVANEPLSKERLREIFNNFDTNRDGGISLEEYKAGTAGNIAPQRVEKVFVEKDRNGDGKLNLEELPTCRRISGQPPLTEKSPKKDDKKSKNQ